MGRRIALVTLLPLMLAGCMSMRQHEVEKGEAWVVGFKSGAAVTAAENEEACMESIQVVARANYKAEYDIRVLEGQLREAKRALKECMDLEGSMK